MFSDKERCQYRHNQLADVICQLRFPQILTINATPPADFQEEIRNDFPIYSSRVELPNPKLTGAPGNLHIEKQSTINNYQFTSADGHWRVNLTSSFISLACNHYTNWEDFAKKLDGPLAAFIKIYKPALFERIGLRYLNSFSRKELNLEDTPFCDLFQPCYLGLLSNDDVSEFATTRSSVDAEISIQGGCKAKIHAGPGIVKKNGQTEKEVKFILDQDLFMSGNIPVNYSAGALETLHSQAYPIFRGAITDILHDAMDPEPI